MDWDTLRLGSDWSIHKDIEGFKSSYHLYQRCGRGAGQKMIRWRMLLPIVAIAPALSSILGFLVGYAHMRGDSDWEGHVKFEEGGGAVCERRLGAE